MNKTRKMKFGMVLAAGMLIIGAACKKSYDFPPQPTDNVNIVANTSIAGLKTYHTIPGAYDLISNDVVISGIVVANDKSGNFYKQLFIQDSTGAMQILINATGLYTSFPVGRRVFVKCKGLTLSDSYSNMVLGVKAIVGGIPSLEGITGGLIGDHIVGGSLNNKVEPLMVDVAQLGTTLNDRYINALVKLTGYEFDAADTLKTYSDTSVYKSTQNRLISKGCGSATKPTLRTSAYADFAGIRLPSGSGSITAVYTIYKSSPTSSTTTKQMIIRDTADVQFKDARCGAPPPGTIVLLDENFEAQTANTASPYLPITITGWQNLSEIGTKKYDARIFSNNKYAYISGFGTNNGDVKTWMVTKGINMDGTNSETLTFDTKQDFYMSTTTGGGFPVPSELQVFISNNYIGAGDPWASGVTWTEITSQATLSPGSTTSNYPSSFTGSGVINLSSYTGTIYIAFKYVGFDNTATTASSGDKTSAWEVDNIRILGLQ
jgi:hypothetical protein